MVFDPHRHQRRTVRLAGYDYRQTGVYYVTICTLDRECLLGEIGDDGFLRHSEYGECARACWEAIPQHFPQAMLDAFVVMPNHVHGILLIDGAANAGQHRDDGRGQHGDDGRGQHVGAQHAAPLPTAAPLQCHAPPRQGPAAPLPNVLPGSLGAIVRSFKSAASRQINALRHTPGWTVWQRNYYERIIRSDDMLDKARHYIACNPARWVEDINHPAQIARLSS